jgi:single-strand DNA-binding protein
MIGNLTRDIELRYLPSGAAVAKSAIATSYKYKSGTGEQKEEVCFLDFNVFGKSAEILNQYVRKGSKVLLEGRLVLEQWTAQDGTNRSKHSLRVENFKFLDSKSDNQQNQGGGYNQQNTYEQQPQAYNPQPQQQSYQQPQYNQPQAQTGGVAPTQNPAIPEINIDEDEIPF